MKLYVICVKNGTPYPVGKGGGTAGYLSHDKANEMKATVKEYDKEYCEHRGGLTIETIESSKALLKFAGFRW